MCTIKGCQCDPGYAPPMCLSSTARPTSLNDNFTDSNIDATKWSEVYGGSIGTICSLQNNGSSLHFNQPGIRKAVTVDLDMTTAQLVHCIALFHVLIHFYLLLLSLISIVECYLFKSTVV